MGKRHLRQMVALRHLLQHARTTVPFYSDRIPQGSIWQDQFELLESLPILDRREVQQAGSMLWSLKGDRTSWRSTTSTGTTGQPITVVFDLPPQQNEIALVMAQADRSGVLPGWMEVGLTNIALHGNAGSRTMRSTWSERATITKWNMIRAWQLGDSDFEYSLRHLEHRLLTGTPSVFELLSDRMLQSRMEVRVAGVILSGEPIDDSSVQLVRDAFHCPVTSLYSCAEVGILGGECSDGGYHVEEAAAIVELLNDDGKSCEDSEEEGQVVVTPLKNYAMPLLRYRLGDRARLTNEPCSCGRTERRLHLASRRPITRLLTTDDALVHSVRFVKLFCTLPVKRINISQRKAGEVDMSYEADEPLDQSARAVVTAAVRNSLGLRTEVHFQRIQRGEALHRSEPRLFIWRRGIAAARQAEPADLEVDDIASWLCQRLGEAASFKPTAAILTGSILQPETMTRFSDIDVTMLVDAAEMSAPWVDLVRKLRQEVPRLRVHIETPNDLAPLIACRLSCEYRTIVGVFDARVLSWPDLNEITAAARAWKHHAHTTLWHYLTDPQPGNDPLGVACLAYKFIVAALRYRHLQSGARTTDTMTVLRSQLVNLRDSNSVDAVIRIAREQRPPPPLDSPEVLQCVKTAIMVVRQLEVN